MFNVINFTQTLQVIIGHKMSAMNMYWQQLLLIKQWIMKFGDNVDENMLINISHKNVQSELENLLSEISKSQGLLLKKKVESLVLDLQNLRREYFTDKLWKILSRKYIY